MSFNPINILVILLSIASQTKGLYIKDLKSKEIKISISDQWQNSEVGEKRVPYIIEFPIDYTCRSDKDCQNIKEGSICWQAKCVCGNDKPISLHKPPKCLKAALLHETCDYNEECTEGTSNSRFYCKKTNISSTCDCLPGYIETIDQSKCVKGYYLNSKCTSRDQCLGFTEFSDCMIKDTLRICQCISGYTRRGHSCQSTITSPNGELTSEEYLLRVSIGTCAVIAFIGVIIFICSIKKKFKKKVQSDSINGEENEGYQRKEEKLPKTENQIPDNKEKLAKAKKAKEEEIARAEAETKQILKDQKKIVKKPNHYCPMKEEDVCKLVKVSKAEISHNSQGHKHEHSHKKKHHEELHGIYNQNYEP